MKDVLAEQLLVLKRMEAQQELSNAFMRNLLKELEAISYDISETHHRVRNLDLK